MYAGQFLVRDLLGEGGMGEVYLVEHQTLHAEFALKVLRPRFQAREDIVMRFRAESRALWELKHPNVVKVHHAGDDPEIGPFMAMEVLRGKNLAQLIYAVGELTIEQSFPIAIEVAETVEAMHAIGIIHRDLKPENIFITTRPGEPRGVKLLDLGAAKIAKYNQPTTEHHKTIGTGKFMSPEHIRGTGLTNQSDIYALGHILYELLAGRHAFGAHHQGNPTHWDYQVWHLNAQAEPLTEIISGFPASMWQVIERSIRKDPRERFPSMQAFAAALRAELARKLAQGGTESLRNPSPPSSRSKVTLEEALSIPTPPGNWTSSLIAEALSSRSGALAGGFGVRKPTERVAGSQDEAPSLAVATLEVLEGKYAGQAYPLAVRSYVIGRDKECDFSLDEGSLSGKHARVEIQSASVWLIHDLGSTNGVEVNGKGVRSVVLSPGQRFRLGRNIFRMVSTTPLAAASERVSRPSVPVPLPTVKMSPIVEHGLGRGVTGASTGARQHPSSAAVQSPLTAQGTAISGPGPNQSAIPRGAAKGVNLAAEHLAKTAPAEQGPTGSPMPFAAPHRVRTAEMQSADLPRAVGVGMGPSASKDPSSAGWSAAPTALYGAPMTTAPPRRSPSVLIAGGVLACLVLVCAVLLVLVRLGVIHFG